MNLNIIFFCFTFLRLRPRRPQACGPPCSRASSLLTYANALAFSPHPHTPPPPITRNPTPSLPPSLPPRSLPPSPPGDGCLQEGISSEASSLAGHLRLGKLVVLYDDNKITIDGNTELSFTEDVCKRYQAYGWQTLVVEDGDNAIESLHEAIESAKADLGRPTLIKVATTLTPPSPHPHPTLTPPSPHPHPTPNPTLTPP